MKTPKRSLAVAVAFLVGSATLAGCGSDSDDAGGGGNLDEMKVAFLTLTPSCNVCVALTDAAVKQMEAEGIEVTTQTSEFEAGADQTQQLNQALSTQPDAIVVWPADTAAIVPALQRARQSHPDVKLLVTTYRPESEDESLYDAFIGVDDKALGAAAAESLVEGIKSAGLATDGGVLVIEGPRGVSTAVLRQQGFEEELARVAPDLEILDSQPANWDQTEATTVSSALYSRYGSDDLVGVFAHSDVMANGAILAAKRSRLNPGKDLVVVGLDCSIEGYNNIKAGAQYAAGLWDPYAIGRTTGDVTIEVLKGETPEKNTFIPSPQITSGNLGDCDSALGK